MELKRLWGTSLWEVSAKFFVTVLRCFISCKISLWYPLFIKQRNYLRQCRNNQNKASTVWSILVKSNEQHWSVGGSAEIQFPRAPSVMWKKNMWIPTILAETCMVIQIKLEVPVMLLGQLASHVSCLSSDLPEPWLFRWW